MTSYSKPTKLVKKIAKQDSEILCLQAGHSPLFSPKIVFKFNCFDF